jgi:hypothetical protein
MLQRILLMTLLVYLVSGCDAASTFKDGLSESNAASAAIEKQVGSKPEVGFSYKNGVLVAVTVQFNGVPSGSVADVEKVSRAAVIDAFKSEPSSLVLSFVFKKAV